VGERESSKITTVRRILIALLLCTSCVAAAPTNQPNDREWSALMADYSWIDSVRKAQAPLPATASRKQMIEASLDTHRKLDSVYAPFMEKLKEYYDRTHDARAASLLAREKIIAGDEYMALLSRYDKALEFYRSAQQIDPTPDVAQRIALAESRRFVGMDAFGSVKSGMKEDQVRQFVGLPREDWIKQVVQNGRVYSVWIYPKEDGGAAAIYFDNGVVYHTNWNAATPPGAATQ
jgi:tetratricopeptide (TPR) repeat protein